MVVLLLAPAAARAASFPVTSTSDTGAGSLRQAMIDANAHANDPGGPDTIPINTTGPLKLESDLPPIADDVDILGPTAGQFTVDGDNQYRPFTTDPGKTVRMSDITITRGRSVPVPATLTPARGGAIYNLGTLTLTRVRVTGNIARANGGTNAFASGGGIENGGTGVLHLVLSSIDNNEASALNATNQNGSSGGGIENGGTLTLDRSTVDANQALSQAGTGGTTNAFGGGISNSGPLSVVRSTVSNNAAIGLLSTSFNAASGGGIANGNTPSVDTLIDRSTIGTNLANAAGPGTGTPTNDVQGGGMLAMQGTFDVRSSTLAHNTGSGSSNLIVWGTLPIKNTIISDPEGPSPVNCTAIGGGTISSQGFNMADDASCSLSATGDQPSTDPKLAPGLATNGGATKTYALHTPDSGDPVPSPAIDAGHRSIMTETVDQRGSMRPSNFMSIPNAMGSDGSDIGAFEALENEPPNTIIDSGPTGIVNDPTPTFTFHSTEAGSTFTCDVGVPVGFRPCTSPRTTAHLPDGPRTFKVRAKDVAGNTDPTPASRPFTVRTAEVKRSGNTLVINSAVGAKDNLKIVRTSATILQVTDLPAGAYTGSGVHTGLGCTRQGDYKAICNAGPITSIAVNSSGGMDRVLNTTTLPSTIKGGAGGDALVGGGSADRLIGGGGVDLFQGGSGSDSIFARDLTSDSVINCDGGGGAPGAADKADLDLLPKDPNAIVAGCETKTRH
jgi:hypothetical protein